MGITEFCGINKKVFKPQRFVPREKRTMAAQSLELVGKAEHSKVEESEQ